MMLAADDFGDFYRQVNGQAPFPWQQDLVKRVLTERVWPQLIDVPTGLGKTALLDVAIFVAAATSAEDGPHRLGRRRTVFVVDRRMVVDEAFDRARRLSAALDAAFRSDQDNVLSAVARGLRDLAPAVDRGLTIPSPIPVDRTPAEVLSVTRMRGGVTWDAAWLDRPDIPGIVVGTVDQVGSRILFRGYGVSDRRKSIDAALVGIDSLILVDEAHLAEAMVSTMTEAYRRDSAGLGLPTASVVRLTATSGDSRLQRFTLNVDAHRDSPVAWRRLNADKQLSVIASDPKAVVATMAEQALALQNAGHDTVLVVCNTVDRAREVHDRLIAPAKATPPDVMTQTRLLIGRSRPADRELLIEDIKERFGTDRTRRADNPPAILVATQTVEVGANLDVDALVSESASWDALVQRLGRLNRLGDYRAAQAVIVHDGVADGPVYGTARDMTWEFLQTAAAQGLDVSPLSCRRLSQQIPAGASATRPAAPLLTFATLDSWARTGPVPVPDAPVAPYLHGLGSTFATVSVAWRDGLIAPDLAGDNAERPAEDVSAALLAVPVRPGELVEVPLYAARRWLAGQSPAPVADLETDVEAPQRERQVRDGFRALAWRGDDAAGPSVGAGIGSTGAWSWINAAGIRAGETIVVPVERGGLDEYGWAPESVTRVLDVCETVRTTTGTGPDATRVTRRHGPLLRLDEGTGKRLGFSSEDSQELRQLIRRMQTDEVAWSLTDLEGEIAAHLITAISRTVARFPGAPPKQRLPGLAWSPTQLGSLASWLAADTSLVPIRDTRNFDADGFLLTPAAGQLRGQEADDEFPECSSMSLGRVSLRAHHANVGDRARDIATALRLPPDLVLAAELAARWHDLGKAEPRFQVMLCGGDEYEALLLDEPLAKSGLAPSNRAGFRTARIHSRLPVGARHEAWSSALIRGYLARLDHPALFDPDLVVHLISSHHGHARPWLPPVHDAHPNEIESFIDGTLSPADDAKITISSVETVDFDHPDRFTRLNDRYGRWGLALLESVVRCADTTVSAEGS